MQTEVRLLGQGVVRANGVEVDPAAWRTTKTFDLLRVLALSAGEPVPIDSLLATFWPQADHARAGTSLRTAACQLRKVLGTHSVVRQGHGLALVDTWVDAQAFREVAPLVEEARLRENHALVVRLVHRAEELYTGDLDVTSTECDTLHDANAQLRTLRARILLDGAEAAGRCGDWHRSLDLAQRAAAVETSERATRALMRAWFAVGETAKPVEEFERLRRHLSDQYGVDPAPQTRALYLEVVSACTEWPPRDAVIGREVEVRQVVTAVTQCLQDPQRVAGVVWLVGASGSGRRTVAQEAARALMVPVVGESAVPGAGATLELLPDQGQLTPGLAVMLRLRAETRRRIMVVPVTVVAAAAVDEDDAVVHVGPLTRPDFRQLLALVLQGSPTERLSYELFAQAHGLPGAGSRMARQRLDAGDLVWTPDGVDSPDEPRRTSRVLPAMAAVQLALAGLLGLEEGSTRVAHERQTTTTLSPATTWSTGHATPRRSRAVTKPWLGDLGVAHRGVTVVPA